MIIDIPAGVMLFCRECDAEVPHREMAGYLVCHLNHPQHVMQAMITMSYDDAFSPAVLLLPRRSWNVAYVQQREQLQAKYLRLRRG